MKKLILIFTLLTMTVSLIACSEKKVDEPTDITITVPEVEEPTTTVPEVEEPTTTVPEVEEPTTTVPEVEEPTTTVPEVEEPIDNALSLEEILTKTYETTGLEFPMLMTQDLTKENQTYMLGLDTFDFISGKVSEPMMSSQAHSVVLFTVEDGADIEGIKADIKANVDGRKWICVEVAEENILVENVGNMIILIMDENSEAIYNAFLEVVQG